MTDKKRIRYIIPCECDHYKSGVIEEHHHFDDNPDIIVDWRDYDDDDYLLIEKKEDESYEEADFGFWYNTLFNV
jgi:hypothetical protein|tara:strand:+ start:38 stop:259 length:222 start_codon:yes stop_codon:yes gene_type:complete